MQSFLAFIVVVVFSSSAVERVCAKGTTFPLDDSTYVTSPTVPNRLRSLHQHPIPGWALFLTWPVVLRGELERVTKLPFYFGRDSLVCQ